jgi:hypothetical protein
MESFTISFCNIVVLDFRDIIYVIIVIYSWHLVICEHFMSICGEQVILGHTCDEYMVLLAKLGMTSCPEFGNLGKIWNFYFKYKIWSKIVAFMLPNIIFVMMIALVFESI